MGIKALSAGKRYPFPCMNCYPALLSERGAVKKKSGYISEAKTPIYVSAGRAKKRGTGLVDIRYLIIKKLTVFITDDRHPYIT